ncbi:PilZ domain-containing protein [Paraliomyxa miuraensis]|uniref:PilZ domain-containing protein n=1 Tax=Paraliomyxa miuraensis TaxID=376150 RepID=UPI00224EE42F|nr:PilZ domain-containing protein [Paraliomyxa miuraensis]MCX4239552.1 PilZ domain-containing protein [Paraliomyxa miuraensis]
MSPNDKRASTRYEVDLPMQVTRDGQVALARTENLSLGGALVRLATELSVKVGDRVEISFRLPDLDKPLSAKADVRWVGDLDQGMIGLQFVTGFRAKETWALNRFLENHGST